MRSASRGTSAARTRRGWSSTQPRSRIQPLSADNSSMHRRESAPALNACQLMLDKLPLAARLSQLMSDPRYTKLAKLLVNYSTALKKGDHILIDVADVPDEFTIELIRASRAAGATPIVETRHTRVGRELLLGADEKQARLSRDLELFRMKKVQAYIAIRGSYNTSENSDVPGNKMAMYSRIIRPVLNQRVNKTRWCVLRWPTPSMAQAAGMSTEAFEDLYFSVCTMDYRKMARAMVPLERRMKKADHVHIKGPGTDLKFSIKGIGAKMCQGDRNIPDGEVFSCPVKNSVNGRIQFNTPTIYSGTKFENVATRIRGWQSGEGDSKQHQAAQ